MFSWSDFAAVSPAVQSPSCGCAGHSPHQIGCAPGLTLMWGNLSQHTTYQCGDITHHLRPQCVVLPAFGTRVWHMQSPKTTAWQGVTLSVRDCRAELFSLSPAQLLHSHLCPAMTAALGPCWQQGALRITETHRHLLIAHYSFIELEQDSCYGWTVTLTLCKPRLTTPAEGRPQ